MARILIVDDEPLNRELLRAFFEGSGHELDDAATGEKGLDLARAHTPDLVLLDVMMPEMDGYETTRRLKAMFTQTVVPVVLCTALNDRASRFAGLAAGADEFLTKPIDRDELLVRARNLLALRAREVELAEHNAELIDLRRFQDDMLAMLVHDLKSPLAVILASLEYVLGQPSTVGEVREALDDCQQAGARITRLVGNILETAHAESGQMVVRKGPLPLAPLLETLLTPRLVQIEARARTLEVDVDGLVAHADRDLIARVVENLLDNAIRYTPSGGRIKVWAQAQGDQIELRVGNTGPSIPESSRGLVFEKYTQVWDANRGSVGLGLYFCRLAVEAHGGRIWIEESPELSTVFAMSLPATPFAAGG